MRKVITKEAKQTTVEFAVVEVQNGEIETTQKDSISYLGSYSHTKALKEISAQKGVSENVMVLDHKEDKTTYELPLEEFLKHASIKEK